MSSSFDRQSVLSTLGRAYTHGMKFAELAAELDVPRSHQTRLRKLLNRMIDQEAIVRLGRGIYAVAKQEQPHSGRISVHPAGYGFVTRDDDSDDVFIPAKFRGTALDGDRVRISTWHGHKGTEGKVEEVLARGRARLTGVVRSRDRTLYVEPDDPRIATDYGHVELQGDMLAPEGKAVVVEITRYPSENDKQICGRIVRTLGDPDDPRTEMAKIIACADIPDEFPQDAAALGKATSTELRPEDFADRIDLRDRPFVTIDPETARDFDDALCIEPGPDSLTRVWVAVADVSHYVRPGDPIDREAAIRGVSVYLPDRVIPMLPFELSAGICSLNPDVDRCAMVARLDIDHKGRVVDTAFAAAVIRSHARLAYPGVAAALAGDFRGRRARYQPWATSLVQLDALARQMRERRMRRGALALDLPEAKVILDDDDSRLIRDVVRSKAAEGVKRAYELVEEFMIAANEAVGAYFRERKLDTVWRVHAPPKSDRLSELARAFASFGIDVDIEEAQSPQGMARVLQQLTDHPAARALTFLVLRSLKQAVYQTDNVGHFGLASKEYLHFTSPIRRYADLLVHRLLKHALHSEGQASAGGGKLRPPRRSELDDLAKATSEHERRAMEAEREAVAMCRAYLMRDQVGEEFPGRVSAVTPFGAFVELDAPYVEALIKIDAIADDTFHHDPVRQKLTGARTRFEISLGDPVTVEITNVSVGTRRIDARLAGAELPPAPPRRTTRRRASTKSTATRSSRNRSRGGPKTPKKTRTKTKSAQKKTRRTKRR